MTVTIQNVIDGMAARVCRALMCGVVAMLAAGDVRAGEPACPDALPRHLVLPVTRAALAAHRPVEIVAFGSSSTEGSGASAPDRTYPARLEALLRAGWPGEAVTIRNRGVGGQTVEALLARLETDVIAMHPTLVIWQVGTNEALRGVDTTQFAALLDEGVRRIKAGGSDLVLMDYQMAPRMPPDEKLSAYGAIIAREAEAQSAPLFSRAGLMREWAGHGATGMIAADGLHHTDRGYACLAAALDEAITAAVAQPIATVSAKVK